jgi:hypothetical protein
MRRAPAAGPDLSVYARAIPLLARNPSIIVIPLLVAVIGILLAQVLSPLGSGGIAQTTGGLAGFILRMLQLFGLGAACVIADEAWRHGSASFERGWTEARRRGSDLLMAALGVAIVESLGSYAGVLVGQWIGYALALLILVFLVWAMPAAAIGGIPGGAAIGVSVERVRENPVPAVIAGIVTLLLLLFAVPFVTVKLIELLIPYVPSFGSIVALLINAVIRAIAIGYIALIVTKTYTDAAFVRRS